LDTGEITRRRNLFCADKRVKKNKVYKGGGEVPSRVGIVKKNGRKGVSGQEKNHEEVLGDEGKGTRNRGGGKKTTSCLKNEEIKIRDYQTLRDRGR